MAESGMNDSLPSTVTQLLAEVRAGSSSAFDELFPLVYEELRQLAHAQRRQWHGEETLNTTALIHEAYLKLAAPAEPDWKSRAHLMSVAAKAMRQILIDYARVQRAKKRGGDRVRVTLDELKLESPSPEFSKQRAEELIQLDESLKRLERRDGRQSRIVECRFFGAMTIRDTAEAVGVSAATVERDWAMAKAWLFRDMGGTQAG